MSLDFTPTGEVVTFPGGQMTVRGLSLADIATLVRSHADLMSDMFSKVAQDPENALSVAAVIGARLLDEAPALAVHAIALAADSADRIEDVARIPFPAQIAALETIARLTFATENDLKKVIETVIRTAQGMTGALQNLQT